MVPTRLKVVQVRIALMVVQVTIISLRHRGIPSLVVQGMMSLPLIHRSPTLAQSPLQVAKQTKKRPLTQRITRMDASATFWICVGWTTWSLHMTTTIPKRALSHIRTTMARWLRSTLAKSNTSLRTQMALLRGQQETI